MGFKDRFSFSAEKDIFTKNDKSPGNQDKCIRAMIHVMAEGISCDLREILYLVQPLFMADALYIIDSETRKMVACTRDAYEVTAVKIAQSIKNLKEKEYYLQHEKNGVFFPKGCKCISVFPLAYSGESAYSLLAEQETVHHVRMDGCMETLSVAVRLYMQEKTASERRYLDATTGFQNRDALLKYLYNANDKKQYLGFLSLKNMEELAAKYGYVWGENTVMLAGTRISKIMSQKNKENLYRYSYNKVCMVLNGTHIYDAVALLQDVMDDLEQNIDGITLGGVIAPMMEDPYRLLLTLEKLSDKATPDTVLVIRDINDLEDNISEETSTFYLADKFTSSKEGEVTGKEEEETFSDLIEKIARDIEREHKDSGTSKPVEEEMQEDLDYIYSIPDNDALNV